MTPIREPVVDDEAAARRLLRTAREGDGSDVVDCADGVEAGAVLIKPIPPATIEAEPARARATAPP